MPVVDSDGWSEAGSRTLTEIEAGVGRWALEFASAELAVDREALEVDSGKAAVGGDKVVGNTQGAVSEQMALATVELVQNKME